MRFQRTGHFKRAYRKLDLGQQNAIKRAISLMSDNINHPSLRVKRVQSTKETWEASAAMDLHITFEWEGGTITLKNCGEHNKTLKNLNRKKGQIFSS